VLAGIRNPSQDRSFASIQQDLSGQPPEGNAQKMGIAQALCHRSSHLRCQAGVNGSQITLVALLEEDGRPGIVAEALMVPRQTRPFK
jgi:hypothetical protein